MDCDENGDESIQRRESEEVEDIESSSEIASEDEQKADQSSPSSANDVERENSIENKIVGDPLEEDHNEDNVDKDIQNSGNTSRSNQHGKDLDIEGELDYEEEAQVKDDSEGENEVDEEDVEPGAKPKPQDKEEGEDDDDDDDGEITDDDLEDGEVKDSSSARKSQPKSVCRFFHKGQCTWGLNCRFIHPGINDKGNYNMFGLLGNKGSYGAETIVSLPATEPTYVQPPPPVPIDDTPAPESAWERGLRHAKEIIKKSIKRKETETDFEEKRMNMSLVESELQAQYEKEADYYSSQSRHRQDDAYYAAYSMYENAANREGYDRRMHHGPWREPRGHANFDQQHWPHSAPEHFREFRERGRHHPGYEREVREVKDGRDRVEYRNQERWHEERYPQAQTNRNNRGDEWRDPWRRSKSPKGTRRSRSKGLSRRSYSSASSASYSSSRSSRSRSSSYSYSKSRSSSRSSKSRSLSFSPVRSKSRTPGGRVKPNNRYHNNNNSNHNNRQAPVPNNRAQNFHNRARSPVHAGAQVARQKPHSSPPRKPKVARARDPKDRSPSFSGSASNKSLSPEPRYRTRSRTFSRSVSRSISISSVSSLSSSITPLTPDELTPKKKPPVADKTKQKVNRHKEGRLSPRERSRRTTDEAVKAPLKPSKDPLKQSSAGKPQIKLTLLKPADKAATLSKRKTIDEMLIEKQKADKAAKNPPTKQSGSKKRQATSPVNSQPPPKASNNLKKSTSSRREELLKQLQAVEDAIARKRTKF